MPPITFDEHSRRNAETLIELAIAEDLGTGFPHLSLNVARGRIELDYPERSAVGSDVTSCMTIPEKAQGAAQFVVRSVGTVAGLPVLAIVLKRFGLSWSEPFVEEGASVTPGTAIARLSGPIRSLLMMERTALNFLQRLSGIATLTARYVSAVEGTKALILDTRKTTPGWRSLEKYAVRCGGGTNHRIGLHDAVLIKDNHLAWLGFLGEADPIAASIRLARKRASRGMIVEVEVDSLDQLDRALACGPDIVLVDNLGPEALSEAVRRRDARAPGVLLEASGGVNLDTVAALAATGVDRISIGALTHSAPALDIGLDFDRSVT